MQTQQQHPRVAVLLATCNGARFIEPQIRSLQDNTTAFTLHWLDDHSTDNTRERVRSLTCALGIELTEWHHPIHQGVPGAFFQLMECAEADIYLFCDQDDIWQPGKVDATVSNLLPDLHTPALCFSDPLTFNDDSPHRLQRVSEMTRLKAPAALQKSSMFVVCPAMGHTIGFTRPLREIFLTHRDIARSFAAMHDSWMYLIASASGACRMLTNVPTTLYRMHGKNTAGLYFSWLGWKGMVHMARRWRLQQAMRRWTSRQAQGFCLASSTLPSGPGLTRALTLARLIATLDRRQSLAALMRLVRYGAMPPCRQFTIGFAAACLFSNATSPATQH